MPTCPQNFFVLPKVLLCTGLPFDEIALLEPGVCQAGDLSRENPLPRWRNLALDLLVHCVSNPSQIPAQSNV